MEEKQAKELLDRYLSGDCTEQEKAAVETWFNLQSGKKESQGISDFEAMNERIMDGLPAGSVIRPKRTRLWPRWVAAASIALAVMAGGYYYYQSRSIVQDQQVVYANDIAPGKDGATLTLADGRKILINDALAGNIAEQSGVKISKTTTGEIIYEVIANDNKILSYNTLATTRGEQTRVRLPDGTLVFLNAESSLRYPTTFAGQGQREVSLKGEGYFEVAKDKAHAFVVSSDGQKVEVLGTHFNINTYSAQVGTMTTLLEGSVKVSDLKSKTSQLLKPNQQAVLSGNGIKVSEVEAEYETAWKDGFFMFNNEPLGNIMDKVARWYDVKVVYEDEGLKKAEFLGTISKFENISKVLSMLEETKLATFTIDKNKVTIKRRAK